MKDVLSMILICSLAITGCLTEQTGNNEQEKERNEESNSRLGRDHSKYESPERGIGSLPDGAFALGSEHADIEVIQKYLNDLGYELAVGGVYDAEMERAIYHFQKEYDDLQNNGVYSSDTQLALKEALQKDVDIETDGYTSIELPYEQQVKGVTHPGDQTNALIPENVIDQAYVEAMVFVDGTLNIRQEPNASAEQVSRLNNGAHIFALEEAGNWTYVYFEDVEGWVHSSYIKEIPYDSTQKQRVDDSNDQFVLVNKKYKLPREYEPEDLVIPDVPFPFEGTPERKYMREEAGQALEELFEASKQEGLELYATSGYRSFSRQEAIFTRNVKSRGFVKANQTSAFPGESEHQTGLAMDVTNAEVGFRLTTNFADTKEGLWVQEHAHEFGFIIRYPKGNEDITGYTYEPWHLRYLGKEAAKEIYERGVTLEEYRGEN